MVELSEEEMSQITGGWINDGWRRRNEQKALSVLRPDLIQIYVEV
jgi:bacteriocin-like protein